MTKKDLFRILSGIAVILTAITLTSCSSKSNPSSTGSGTGSGTPNSVVMQGIAFSPTGLTVPAGTEVTWTNNDNVAHTVTSDDGGFTSSGTLNHNDTYKVTFTAAGSYPYHCTIHPSMTGTITVTP